MICSEFPEVTGALVFFICTSCNILVEHFQEPANVVKPFAPGIDQNIKLIAFVGFQMFAVDKFLRDFFSLVELVPSLNNVFCLSVVGAIPVYMQNDMIVIRKYGECRHIDVEDGSEPQEIMFELMSAVFIGATSPSDRVFSA